MVIKKIIAQIFPEEIERCLVFEFPISLDMDDDLYLHEQIQISNIPELELVKSNFDNLLLSGN